MCLTELRATLAALWRYCSKFCIIANVSMLAYNVNIVTVTLKGSLRSHFLYCVNFIGIELSLKRFSFYTLWLPPKHSNLCSSSDVLVPNPVHPRYPQRKSQRLLPLLLPLPPLLSPVFWSVPPSPNLIFPFACNLLSQTTPDTFLHPFYSTCYSEKLTWHVKFPPRFIQKYSN